MSSSQTPVWFITSCSTGFGRELAKLVLARGWRAVMTARNPAQLDDLLEGRADQALALGSTAPTARTSGTPSRRPSASSGGSTCW